jgi:hypothetical protein
MPRPLPLFRKGDVPRAADFMELRTAIMRQRVVAGQGSGIDVQEMPDCTMIRGRPTVARLWGVANGTISPRSGATPGTGSMTVYQYNGTALASTGLNIDVINVSATTMSSGHGIDSGQYCAADLDPDGWWLVTPLECS